MFQSYLDHSLNQEMILFKEKFNHMNSRPEFGLEDPWEYNDRLQNFSNLWSERSEYTELLMHLWSRCSNIHVSKMTSLTSEFDKKSADFKNIEMKREKLLNLEKPNCANRLSRLKA